MRSVGERYEILEHTSISIDERLISVLYRIVHISLTSMFNVHKVLQGYMCA